MTRPDRRNAANNLPLQRSRNQRRRPIDPASTGAKTVLRLPLTTDGPDQRSPHETARRRAGFSHAIRGALTTLGSAMSRSRTATPAGTLPGSTTAAPLSTSSKVLAPGQRILETPLAAGVEASGSTLYATIGAFGNGTLISVPL